MTPDIDSIISSAKQSADTATDLETLRAEYLSNLNTIQALAKKGAHERAIMKEALEWISTDDYTLPLVVNKAKQALEKVKEVQ